MTHAYPRFQGDIAGNFIARLNEALAADGHHIRVVAPADRGEIVNGFHKTGDIDLSYFRYAPRRFETLAYSGTMAEQAKNPIMALALANLIRRQSHFASREKIDWQTDLIHAHWWIPGGLAAWWGTMRNSVPYIVTLHGSDVRLLNQSRTGRLLARKVFERAGRVVAVSAFLADLASQMTGFERNRIVVQPMPVETFPEVTSKKGGNGIVVVGRLSPQKNLDLILETVADLKEKGTGINVSFVGDGSERGNLERIASSLGIGDKVVFHGNVPSKEMAPVVSNADVAIFTAQDEGFGLAAAEMLMLGVPIIVCEGGGGLLEIIDDPMAGLIVSPNKEELGEGVMQIVGDDEVRNAAVKAGERWRTKLAKQNVAQLYSALYREVISAV